MLVVTSSLAGKPMAEMNDARGDFFLDRQTDGPAKYDIVALLMRDQAHVGDQIRCRPSTNRQTGPCILDPNGCTPYYSTIWDE